jgi:hypothetical protein
VLRERGRGEYLNVAAGVAVLAGIAALATDSQITGTR